ncbi:hypothetical protein BZB76_1838 [Actinomadura pelletieri DSM 43383]|uniref:DUF7715 domain-containing protein n=1 Tax=Actinomadura pelletieri DSM 43383 TaxID=1120940 RepID=A0A495QSJ5_9ACTN|nr:hypothetical protein [Actinomadura pelletieri]RKS76482.1 hypothetical protein BZB76_1838 [Actinomadura pelletieri DSM 43383]
MRVLTAPNTQDPRDGGFVATLPGELLYRPFVCASGQDGRCGCERSLAGMTTRKGTTLAEVTDKDMTLADYIDAHASFLVDVWGWDRAGAEDEARALADVASDFPAGTLVTVQLQDEAHVFDALEA